MSEQSCFICEKPLAAKYAELSTCDHRFHLSCLMKWSSEKTVIDKQTQTCYCPVTFCGKNFESIRILITDDNKKVNRQIIIRNLICLKCKSFLKPPILMTGCCGRSYCLDCISPQLQRRFKCPLDRNLLTRICALNWIRESIIFFEATYKPGMVIVEHIGRALSSDFVCRVCGSTENIDDISYCFCCSSCYHYKCDPKVNLKGHQLITVCSACIKRSKTTQVAN